MFIYTQKINNKMKNNTRQKRTIKNKTKKKTKNYTHTQKLKYLYPDIYQINRYTSNNNYQKKHLNILLDKVDLPKDFTYLVENVRKIANLWNTNPLLKKRLSYSSKDCMDLLHLNDISQFSIQMQPNEPFKEEEYNNGGNLQTRDFVRKLKTMDYSKPNKKMLEDILTDFNTVHFFNSLTTRLRFIKIVIYTFQEFFKVIYLKDKRFNSNNLNLMFKGGTVIRFIVTEYLRGFSKDIQDFIKMDIRKNIKMSDYDYEFMTSSNISQEDFIQLNILIYLVTILIRNNLYRNRYFIFDFFQLSEKTQITKMKEVKKQLQQQIDTNSNNMDNNNLFKDINIQYIDFLGCSNNIIVAPKPKDGEILHRYKSINKTHNHQYCKKDYGIIADGSSNLSQEKLHIIQAMDLLKLYKIPNAIIKHIIYPYKSVNKDDPGRNIYNRFVATHNPLVENSNDPNNIIKFQLNRIKYIYNIYFSKQIDINGNKQTLYIKFPLLGEILDLSHAYLADRKKNKFNIDFNQNQYFQKYSFLHYDLDFYSYSVIGLIADLDSIIFDETHYQPWNDIKYAKRLKRILYLYIFYLFSNEINDKYNSKVMDLQLLVQLCSNDFSHFDRNKFTIKSNIFDRLIVSLYKTSNNKKQPQYKQYKIDLMECLDNLLLIFNAQKTASKQFQLNIGYLSNQILNIEFPSLY